ncbi:MAG: hypothetical protein RL757_368 [Bacteroidota bacterium]|jgi:RimJ/RimL family protein N-acetyltransferase
MKNKDLEIINCTAPIVEKILESDAAFAQFLNVGLAKDWSIFGKMVFEFVAKQIETNPNATEWWSYVICHLPDNKIIGTCGYKGAPDPNGRIEIGYEIAPDYQNRGLATQVARLLVENAFAHAHIHEVWAHTIERNNASTRVLEKAGFLFDCEVMDSEDGLIFRWILKK